MAENERDFKGVWIPKSVWLDERLSALDKMILTEIDSLDQTERGCYASNKYIADFCQCSETKVSKSISKLIEYGYVYVMSFDGRQRELKSRLSENTNLPCKKYKAEMQKMQEINTSNNTDIKKDIKKERKKASFDDILSAYTSDEKTLELLGEWLKVRKAKRAAMTDTAIRLNINKLDKLASESGLSVPEYLEEVICRGWAAFYAIKNNSGNYSNGTGAEERRTVNGKEYLYRNGKYYIPNGSGIAVNPFAEDDLDFLG